MNLAAVVAATLASYVFGSLWYLWLGKSWRHAVGWTETTPPYRPSPAELLVALIGQILMAAGLSLVLPHFGVTGAGSGFLVASFIWLAFIIPSLSTNIVFQRRNRMLIWQDGLHWLWVLAAQGLVLGALA